MQERHKDYKTYFEESISSSVKYYIPYIKECASLPIGKSLKVLEVGCGLGGNLFPFAEMGCKVSGVDIDALSVEYAKAFYAERGVEADFTCEDIHAYADDVKYDLTHFATGFDFNHIEKGRYPDAHIGYNQCQICPPYISFLGQFQTHFSRRLICYAPYGINWLIGSA